jgi:hypothetical protein
MAKRRKAARSSSRSKKGIYKVETYGIKYNSLTFLLFLVFALIVSMLLVSSMLGMNLY